MAGIRSAEVASQVPFYDLCSLLEKIAVTTGIEKKKKILTTFVSSWREAHGKLHGASKTVEWPRVTRNTKFNYCDCEKKVTSLRHRPHPPPPKEELHR